MIMLDQAPPNLAYDSMTPSRGSERGDAEKEHSVKQGRKQNFSKESTSIMKKWLIDHVEHPYLKANDKNALSRESGLNKRQVQNWFTNVRKVMNPHLLKQFIVENLATLDEQVLKQERSQENCSKTQAQARLF